MLWGKVVITAGVGAVAALTRVRNGKLLELEPAKLLMNKAVSEAAEIVKAAGIRLPFNSPLAQAEQLISRTSNNLGSMLQDLYQGRRTEVDFINGAVVRLAESLGLDAPVNRTLTLLIQTAEHSS